MGMNPKTQKRKGKGRPDGGQFAPETHEAVPNDLDEAPFDNPGDDGLSLAELAGQQDQDHDTSLFEQNFNGRQVVDALMNEPVGSAKREHAKKLYIESINRNLDRYYKTWGSSRGEKGRTIHGKTGWTSKILPYTLDYSDCSTQYCAVGESYTGQDVIGTNFTEFKQADAALAQHLLDTVPKHNLEKERQNQAPTVGNILKFVKKHPDQASFGGYVVSGERPDERLSIETVSVSPELLGAGQDATEDDAREKLHDLKLGEVSSPDETRWDKNQNRWKFRWY